MINHQNFAYSTGYPLQAGDRYYGQDLGRDFYFQQDTIGSGLLAGFGIALGTPSLLKMAAPTVDGVTPNKVIDIPAGSAVLPFTITLPDSYAALPPTTLTASVNMPINWSAFTIDVSTLGCTGVATYNLYASYSEVVKKTRSRAKASGTYGYEVLPTLSLGATTGSIPAGSVLLCTFTYNSGSSPITSIVVSSFGFLSIIYGKTLSVNKSLTLDGVDSKTLSVNKSLTLDGVDGDLVDFNALIRSCYQGLILTYVGTTSFSVGVGAVGDSTFVATMVLAAATTKTTSAWAVGSGNGGLDTGAIGASTWYYVYLIKRVDTGVVDVLFSTSSTSPTMPTNYTLKRMIGAVLTNGSSQFVNFKMLADGETVWPTLTTDVNDSTLTTSRKTYTVASVPAVQHDTSFNLYMTNASGGNLFLTGDSNDADVAPSGAGPVTASMGMPTAGSDNIARMSRFFMTGQSLYARALNASTTIRVSVRSFNIRPYN